MRAGHLGFFSSQKVVERSVIGSAQEMEHRTEVLLLEQAERAVAEKTGLRVPYPTTKPMRPARHLGRERRVGGTTKWWPKHKGPFRVCMSNKLAVPGLDWLLRKQAPSDRVAGYQSYLSRHK